MFAPELLHHYPLFNPLTIQELKAVATISEEATYPGGTVIFEENAPADYLYVLSKGGVDLFFTFDVGLSPYEHKEVSFDHIRPGEVFGISALIEPYVYTSLARVSGPSEVVKIEAAKLRALFENDASLAQKLMLQVAKATLERLSATRLQLATAWYAAREQQAEKK